MRRIVAVVVFAVGAGEVRADVIPASGTEPYAGAVTATVEPVAGGPTRGLAARSAVVDHRTGTAVPVATRLHPVVGSVQRGHLTNPFTGKSNYRSTVYNPVLGSFGTYKFRR